MQKYFTTEVSDEVFAHAKESLQKKDQTVKQSVKQINPFQEIDDRNMLLEKIRNELALKTDPHQKLIKKNLAKVHPITK